ncbi:MAG: ABC transporter permease [Pseudonocardiaceae bacterium]
MGRLIKAEFRKVLTTRLWWALMIPTVLVALGWAWGFSALATEIANDVNDDPIFREAGVSFNDISWSALAFTRAINISTIFPMVFGALAIASEISRKTITTSFLTAPTRTELLGAKAITYVVWGAVYGVVIVGAASLGLLLGSGESHLVGFSAWLAIAGSGVLSCVLWTLLGIGVGALIGSPVGSLVLLLIYALLVGPVSELLLAGLAEGGTSIAGWLPNGSANGLTGSTAANVIVGQIQDIANSTGAGLIPADIVEPFEEAVRWAAGAPGALTLWASGLIFFGWTMVLFIGGLFRTQTRDVT